jgi:alpha-ribazole phosphatase/probable phosphoglycerate mutase
MSTRLFLVRHGESVWNAEGRTQGQADPPLSVRGLAQSNALAEALGPRPLAAVYCSPLRRARDTAWRIAAPHGLQTQVLDALSELHLGHWQGRPLGDLESWEDGGAATWETEPPGGETLAEARARVAPAIDALIEAHRGETLVVVAHSIIGRVMLCHLLQTGLDLVPRLKLKQASISLVRLEGEHAVLERLGDTGHLRAVHAPPDGGVPDVSAIGGRA